MCFSLSPACCFHYNSLLFQAVDILLILLKREDQRKKAVVCGVTVTNPFLANTSCSNEITLGIKRNLQICSEGIDSVLLSGPEGKGGQKIHQRLIDWAAKRNKISTSRIFLTWIYTGLTAGSFKSKVI